MNDNYAKPLNEEPILGQPVPYTNYSSVPMPPPIPYEAQLLSPTLYGQTRLQFVRKVYAILTSTSPILFSPTSNYRCYDNCSHVLRTIHDLPDQ